MLLDFGTSLDFASYKLFKKLVSSKVLTNCKSLRITAVGKRVICDTHASFDQVLWLLDVTQW